MNKITLKQFNDRSSCKIGILVRNKEDLEKVKLFVSEQITGEYNYNHEDNDFPIIFRSRCNIFGFPCYVRIFKNDYETSKRDFKEFIDDDIIVSVNQLDIPKNYYSGKVICITDTEYFTKGKVYEIENGELIDDDGDGDSVTNYEGCDKFETFSDCNAFCEETQFIELVED